MSLTWGASQHKAAPAPRLAGADPSEICAFAASPLSGLYPAVVDDYPTDGARNLPQRC